MDISHAYPTAPWNRSIESQRTIRGIHEVPLISIIHATVSCGLQERIPRSTAYLNQGKRSILTGAESKAPIKKARNQIKEDKKAGIKKYGIESYLYRIVFFESEGQFWLENYFSPLDLTPRLFGKPPNYLVTQKLSRALHTQPHPLAHKKTEQGVLLRSFAFQVNFTSLVKILNT